MTNNEKPLSGLTAERFTGSSPEVEHQASEERRFLKDLAATCAGFDPKQSKAELDNWGGWWRNRFREDPARAWRILAEVASMIREKRVRRNAGAAAKDLWDRFK